MGEKKQFIFLTSSRRWRRWRRKKEEEVEEETDRKRGSFLVTVTDIGFWD